MVPRHLIKHYSRCLYEGVFCVIEIINKPIYSKNRGEFYLIQTEDYCPGDNLSESSEELLQQSIVFNTVLCLIRTKNIKYDRGTFV